MPPLIAIVEDDPDQRHNYAEALKLRQYQVACYGNRQAALAGFAERMPDLAILDVMLEGEVDGGFDLCRELLARDPELPVIFLSSRSDEIDQVHGLRLGAWDYQTKPVSLILLVERVAALLKVARSRQTDRSRVIHRGELVLDAEQVAVHWRGGRLPLTVTECALLERIVAKAGGVASYDELARATRQTLVTNNTLNTHVRHIRNKFQKLDPGFDALENVYGAGYRWRQDGD